MHTSLLHEMPFGAQPLDSGDVRFRLWAPDARRAEVALGRESLEHSLPMEAVGGGWFELLTGAVGAGAHYRFQLDGATVVPDPASRFQPDGVHGPSEVIDPRGYEWRDAWRGRPWKEAVLYELHVGTFTEGGTFRSAIERLPFLADVGITAIEVMPVATFAGTRNWGYDGVLPFAPHPAYGRPDDFRAFVDAAQQQGLMVLLDVVYNHFGPEGNWLHRYASSFFTNRHRTPWGEAINFDGPDSRTVRDFFVHNALYWLEEYRLDGLRLDAVHAIADDSQPDIVAELTAAVHEGPGRSRDVHVVLENHDNEAHYLGRCDAGPRPACRAQWNDDFHHAAHILLTGESDGYYVDYADRPIAWLARTLSEGFAYQGDRSEFHGGEPRGEPSRELPLTAFISFLQNHDQVGNRALGERLTALAGENALRALMSVMLLGPSVPALFMGEEFGCRQPFLYFADFDGELAEAVRQGRKREFARFAQFGGDLPDPMSIDTFRRSVLDWDVMAQAPHAEWLAYCRELLLLRRRVVVPGLPATTHAVPELFADSGMLVTWRLQNDGILTLLANLGERAVSVTASEPPRGRVLHAQPATAAEGPELPPWSAVWFVRN